MALITSGCAPISIIPCSVGIGLLGMLESAQLLISLGLGCGVDKVIAWTITGHDGPNHLG